MSHNGPDDVSVDIRYEVFIHGTPPPTRDELLARAAFKAEQILKEALALRDAATALLELLIELAQEDEVDDDQTT